MKIFNIGAFTNKDRDVENLDNNSRITRALFGAGLIGFVMTTPVAPLGWYAVLPLIAILPIFSAITGWDPIKAMFQHPMITSWALHFPKTLRYAVGGVGVALISSVYIASYFETTLGLLAVLPIVGIYPVFAAIAGMDPITALYNLESGSVPTPMDEAVGQEKQSALEVINGKKSSAKAELKTQHSKAA